MSFKQYMMLSLKHIVSSQFLPANLDNVVRLKRVHVNIQTKKAKQINYFYLWFFTHQRPASFRFHLSKKNTSQNSIVKTKVKKQHLQVAIKKRKQYFFLQMLLKYLIIKQVTSETKIWTFSRHCVNVNIPTAILTHRTAGLQAKNNYFPIISLQIRFRFSQATAFEKLFLLRAFQILDSHQKLKGLEVV